MNWKEVVTSPHLQDLPFKIETNEWGQIVMTPAKIVHGKYQYLIGRLLEDLTKQPGEVVTEVAVQTKKGTKVADVAWFSAVRYSLVKNEFDSPIAPEICVEVRSPGNSTREMDEKRELYFSAGALEVWVCSTHGKMRFYSHNGEMKTSGLVPDFPGNIANRISGASFEPKNN